MLAAAALAETPPPPTTMLADSVAVTDGQTLMDIARTHDLGFVEVLAANPGLDPWLPPQGADVLLPAAHLPPPALADTALVVNLAEMRLYWRPPSGPAESFPVGIGRDGMGLGATMTQVAAKRRAPVWVPPPSVRAEKPWLPERVPPGPDNPLGEFSLDLADGLVRIHGTNLPDGVGRRVSHGCFRLYPEDIARLFPQIPVGTAVAIVDEPVKLAATADGALWLEIHRGQDHADAVEAGSPPPPPRLPGLESRIAALAGSAAARIDWRAVAWARDHAPGLPIRIAAAVGPAPMPLLPAETMVTAVR